MRALSIVRFVLLAGWPFAVYFGLKRFEPRYLAFLILVLLLLRKGSFKKVKAIKAADWSVFAITAVLAAGIYLSNSETLLRLYPVVVSCGLLAVFALSLINPPTIIERVARADTPDLSPAGVRYTTRVTVVWCAFFIINATIAAITAFFSSREIWVFYNGFLSYMLIGIIFCCEWIVRRVYMNKREYA